jgi:hypothetical protein
MWHRPAQTLLSVPFFDPCRHTQKCLWGMSISIVPHVGSQISDAPHVNEFFTSSMKRFFILLLCAAIVHACLVIGLLSLALPRAEREFYEGNLPGHALFRAMGTVAYALSYPLVVMPRGEVIEPRTSLLFASNSLVWGLLISAAFTLVSRYRTRKDDMSAVNRPIE